MRFFRYFFLLAILLFFIPVIRAVPTITVVDSAGDVGRFPSIVLNASGYIVAQRKAAVASKMTGRLTALLVEEGSPVRKGQVLARMENEDLEAMKSQAEANQANARAVELVDGVQATTSQLVPPARPPSEVLIVEVLAVPPLPPIPGATPPLPIHVDVAPPVRIHWPPDPADGTAVLIPPSEAPAAPA